MPLPVPHFSWQVQALEGQCASGNAGKVFHFPLETLRGAEDILYVHPGVGRVVTQRLGSGRVLAVDSRSLAMIMLRNSFACVVSFGRC